MLCFMFLESVELVAGLRINSHIRRRERTCDGKLNKTLPKHINPKRDPKNIKIQPKVELQEIMKN